MSGKYKVECEICDITTEIEVKYDNDHPQHCPMCGEDAIDIEHLEVEVIPI